MKLANRMKEDIENKQITPIELKDGKGFKVIIVRHRLNAILKKFTMYGDIAIQHSPDDLAVIWATAKILLQVRWKP